MEADVEGLIGASWHERSADRVNSRNGFRDRTLNTRSRRGLLLTMLGHQTIAHTETGAAAALLSQRTRPGGRRCFRSNPCSVDHKRALP